MSNLENQYTIVFYQENNIVGATNFVTTKENVRIVGEVLSNCSGDYLPNKGIYDTVGWIKSTNIEDILDKAINEASIQAIISINKIQNKKDNDENN